MDSLSLPLPQPLLPGRFLRRVNRFAAEVEVEGDIRRVHLPNSGRMEELLVPGAAVRVHPTGSSRTWGTLLLVRHRRRWVGLDSHLPNRLWEEACRAGGLPPVVGVRTWEREVRLQGERVDFRVRAADGIWLVETKSCNRVLRGVALFPDAPTARGARHMRLLERLARQGTRAAVVWFVQRDDAIRLRLDRTADPDLAEAGARAARAGVVLCAYRCHVDPRTVRVRDPIPVEVFV
ncbi:MAG: DNA/RNA nuclease SfsA [Armatimonadota bacterium]|nr:DNA/RNA nuclease SfsA [Armatimonadota bacterium]MDR7443134.1 DNA/RNA nuclease SfsA [Armatimonadota bacterium]MDR7569595.1 DNA/RNA nuclease SfsA [Armatimonadota bacterium]MDR7614649.1 DNA/RNA nuclease SfsA [Armatimonadota bacterium]